MARPTEDLRIRAVRPMLPPAILHEEVPIAAEAAELVSRARGVVEAALRGEDRRLVAVVGPCSIHDVGAAREYAAELRKLADLHSDRLVVLMRCYFEKPRTTVGWKGLVNDPRMDGSFRVNEGLRLARGLLADVTALGLPTATEFLDTTVAQHTADFIAWGAIGARTTESQVHRELASGLSMPVGFKNATDGNVQVAIDAMRAASEPHWFPGVTKDGVAAVLQTSGNPTCHVVLRGGSRGTNYDRESVAEVAERLERAGLPHRVMVDLSHGNSNKDYRRQVEVGRAVAEQVASGTSPIFGVMIESNLVEGRQDARPGEPLVYGQSVTDACISLPQTADLLRQLAGSVRV